MIDPRALQQHFKNVHKKLNPVKQSVPRIPDLVPLTSFQAIPIFEEIKTEPVLTNFDTETPILETSVKEKINLLINIEPPLDTIVINDVEIDEVVETVSSPDPGNYDPYGYYSGPVY